MNPSQSTSGAFEEDLFLAAQAISDEAGRADFLDRACAGHPELRARIEGLLRAGAAADSFLERPAPRSLDSPTSPDSGMPAPVTGEGSRASDDESPGSRIGPYRLLERLGEGGFGTVHAAEQLHPIRRRVALKILKPGMDTRQVVARFEVERQALAVMDHPNIARVFDAGATTAGRPYFAMELVRGIPITRYCDENALPTPDRVRLFITVCQAVQHAHQKGIIHRDLKPSNILVTLHDGVPVPKIIDFGIAKATRGELTELTVYTQLAQFIGTPAYMSPEQAEMSGLDIDTRSDLYSLGVLLYELLVGRTPFDGRELLQSGVDALRRTLREREPLRPSTRLADLDVPERTTLARRRGVADARRLVEHLRGDLDWVVMKCLEKDRTRRYETASHLAEDLRRHLASLPIEARPPSLLYQWQKAFRRHRLAFLAGAAIASSLVGGIVVASWQARVASVARRQAEDLRGQEANLRGAAEVARNEAEARRVEAEATAQALQLQRAKESFGAGRVREGFDQLGRILRANPSNAVASERFAAALLHHPLPRPLLAPLRHDGAVRTVEFSPDGQFLLTASSDGAARLWNAASGEPVGDPLREDAPLEMASFGPDGQRFVVATSKGRVVLRRTRTAQVVGEPIQLAEGRAIAEFSPDGHWLLAARRTQSSPSDEVRIVRIDVSPSTTHRILVPGAIRSVHFSPDSSRIVTATEDRIARVWEVGSRRLMAASRRHDAMLVAARFTPDGDSIITVDGRDAVRIWDARTGEPRDHPMLHDDYASDVVFSPDGDHLASFSRGGTARVWNWRTQRPATPPLPHGSMVHGAAFCPHGLLLATVAGDGSARLWDAHTGTLALVPITHGFHPVLGVRFDPSGRRLVTCGSEGTVRIWDVSALPARPEFVPTSTTVQHMWFAPDGRTLVTRSPGCLPVAWALDPLRRVDRPVRDHEFVAMQYDPAEVPPDLWQDPIEAWGLDPASPLARTFAPGALSTARAFLSPDGSRVLTWVGPGHPIGLWNARTGQSIPGFQAAPGRSLGVEFSPDSSLVAYAADGGLVERHETDLGTRLPNPIRHSPDVAVMGFSPDGRWIATTAPRDSDVRVWDARTGQPNPAPLRHDSPVVGFEFSPNGRRIATWAMDRTARVWEWPSGKPLAVPLVHAAPVRQVCFNADGSRLATTTSDRFLRLWDVPSGQPISDPWPDDSSITSAAFSPDGHSLMVANLFGLRRIRSRPLPTPVPSWFLDWAEALLGRRFTERGSAPRGTPPERGPAVALRVNQPSGEPFAELVRWIESPPDQRPLAPGSQVFKEGAVADILTEARRRMELGEPAEGIRYFRSAIRLAPDFAESWSELGLHLLRQASPRTRRTSFQAAFHLRRSLELDSNQPDLWLELARLHALAGRHDDALSSLAGLQAADSDRAEVWSLAATLLGASDRHHDALAAASRALALLHDRPALPGSEAFHARCRWAAEAARVGRTNESAALLGELRIPPRPASATPRQIDLTAFYDAGFQGNWHGDQPDNDLSELPTGVHDLAGTTFDLRGLVQLRSSVQRTNLFRPAILAIPVGLEAERLRILHGTLWGWDAPAGTPLATLRVHYADGSRVERDLVLGADALDWFSPPPNIRMQSNNVARSDTGVHVAWEGANARSRASNQTIRLHATTWKNPNPRTAISRIDLFAESAPAALFVVAITAE